MGIITDVIGYTDNTLLQYAQNAFTVIAGPLSTVLATAGVVSVLFVTLNNIFQFTTINISTYVTWVLRFAVIFAFATIWQNFELIYNLFITVPEEYIGILLSAATVNLNGSPNTDLYDPGRVTDIYSALDEFGNGIFYVSGEMFGAMGGWNVGKNIRYALLGIAVAIVGVIFIVAALVIVLVGKVGFAAAVGLAPLAISFLLFPQTRGYFQSWLNFTTGFAVIPLLTGAIMAVVISVAVSTTTGGDDFLRGFLPFVLVAICALVLLFQLPTMASALAQTSVAAVGAGAALAMTRMAIKAPFSAASAAKNFSYAQSQARMAGQGRMASIGSALGAMRVGSQVRQQRLYNSIPALRSPAGNAQRALPSPSGSGSSSGRSVKPLSEEMRKNMNK
jgi:type IV secretion system protein VirB6